MRRVEPGPVHGEVLAPPSKSYTHRALVVGSLSGRSFRVIAPLRSDDTRATARGLQCIGSRVIPDGPDWVIEPSRDLRARRRVVRCGASGTTLRFLTCLAAKSNLSTRFEGSSELARRPIRPLLRTLGQLGAEVRYSEPGRSLPLRLRGPMQGGTADVEVSESSQLLSGLLLTLPTLPQGSTLRWRTKPVSWPYVEATRAMLATTGVSVELDRRSGRAVIPGHQRPRGSTIAVPGDASSAAYLWASAAITGGSVTVHGISPQWPQADLQILDILREMGARVRRSRRGISVDGPIVAPTRCDLTMAPDLLPLVGVLAASVPGQSRIRGASHAAFKESDRRRATLRLVQELGARGSLAAKRLDVFGARALRPVRNRRFADHRLVMSAAVAALAGTGPSTIGDSSAVGKSFPEFWSTLGSLGAASVEVSR